MDTLLNILDKTTDFFKKYGVESPRLDAELLIAHVLNCQRMQLYLDFERPMPEEVLQQLRPLLKRRAAREPIQYILGSTQFMDFELFTDKRALIPRPETEELIEKIEQDYQGKAPPQKILDLGTGTGAIACALARVFPNSEVVATDVSGETLELCRQNVENLTLNERVTLLKSDWFECVEGVFDLIVSNPPYLSDSELGDVEPELLNHEPSGALSSGPSGMESIEVLLKNAPDYLSPNGRLYLETGCGQAEEIKQYWKSLGHPEAPFSCINDLNQKHRFVRFIRG